MSPVRTARGLVLACHPLPTLAVTASSAGLAALAGLDRATGPLLLFGASAVILLAPEHYRAAWRWAVLVAAGVVAATAIGLGLTRPSRRIFFLATVLIAVGDVVLFGLAGGRLA